MHTLLVLEPGHFHAALVLRDRNPRVDRSVHVYSSNGPELDAFLGLVDGFNTRTTDPTAWEIRVHRSDEPLARLIAERRGDVVVVAGRNSAKLPAIRRLHDAGFHVLADKPLITTSEALPDLDRITAGPPLALDLMTERHAIATRIRRRIVATESVFGRFTERPDRQPALWFESVHHLCKTVDGRPLRRPPWYYDVSIQGDGVVDIQSHLVDQAQWLIEAAGGSDAAKPGFVIDGARRWTTAVPLDVFVESTGEPAFPPSLSAAVRHGVLDLACNGLIDYRLDGVRVRQRTEWRLRCEPGGGDEHRSVAEGTGARVVLRAGRETGHESQIHIGPSRRDRESDDRLEGRLVERLGEWREEFPGLALQPSELGHEVIVPPALRTPHETTFAPVLDAFLDRLDGAGWSSSDASRINARYTMLARARDRAVDGPPA